MQDITWICFIWLAAGFMTGITSFGGNLIAVPLLLFIVSPHDAIFMGYSAGGTMCLVIAMVWYRHILWKELFLLAPITFLGIPLGVLFYKYVHVKVIFLSAGSLLLAFLLWNALASLLTINKQLINRQWLLILGAVSGFLNSSIGMGGPPLAIYAFMRNWDTKEALATINACACIIMPVIIFINLQYSISNNLISLQNSFISSICAAFGVITSIPVIHYINKMLFRKIILLMIMFSCISLYVRGIN